MQHRFSLQAGPHKILLSASSRAALIDEVAASFRARRGFSLATINLDHAVKLKAKKAFQDAYASQTFVVADGNPIVWLSKLAGRPVELIPGSELIEPLSQLAAKENVPVALLGATDDTLEKAAHYLEAQYSGLQVVAMLAPSGQFDPNGEEADALLKKLGASGARLCFLALGAPKQEILAARARKILPEVGFVSIGAGLDFLSGSQIRAPLVVRKLAMEWLWRMMLSPRRLFWRYFQCALILPGLAARSLRQRFEA